MILYSIYTLEYSIYLVTRLLDIFDCLVLKSFDPAALHVLVDGMIGYLREDLKMTDMKLRERRNVHSDSCMTK